jgi:hypothetical protein
MIEVLADSGSLVVLGVGDEWLMALPVAGSGFIQSWGTFAVKVEEGNAVGRIASIEGPIQIVPLERIRALMRDSER